MEFWNEELTHEQEEALLDKAAHAVIRRGMVTPAIMALEMHKPLAHVGANAALVFSPFLVPLFGFEAVNDYSRLFRSRANVERLIQKLEGPPGLTTPFPSPLVP